VLLKALQVHMHTLFTTWPTCCAMPCWAIFVVSAKNHNLRLLMSNQFFSRKQKWFMYRSQPQARVLLRLTVALKVLPTLLQLFRKLNEWSVGVLRFHSMKKV
jgi:hypothetical protein